MVTKAELDVVLGDIRDPLCVREAMRGCEQVFHLAALIAIPYSYLAPSSYIDTNIHGTLNVVQAARDLGVKRVVHTSTSETYGTAQFVPITEDHPLVGQSPYAASKIGADQIALATGVVLRPRYLFCVRLIPGPRQSARAVIPTIITQIASGQGRSSLGLSPTRDFNFVADTCSAFLAISCCDEALGQVVNAASNFEISIGDTAALIAEVMNCQVEIFTDERRLRPRGSEVNGFMVLIVFFEDSLAGSLPMVGSKVSGEVWRLPPNGSTIPAILIFIVQGPTQYDRFVSFGACTGYPASGWFQQP